jgi:hypothetical protein
LAEADPKVKNLRNTYFRAILIDILHFHNPQATSGLYKLFLEIFDIIYNPTDHLRPDYGLFFQNL